MLRRTRRRSLPVLSVRSPDTHTRVHVRRSLRPGMYTVDPGLYSTSRAPERFSGRLRALRAAQHRAAPGDPPLTPPHVPDEPHRRVPYSTRAPLLGTNRRGRDDIYLYRYRHGTYVVCAAPVYNAFGELVRWKQHGYRNRRAALRGYQHAPHHEPPGAYATVHRMPRNTAQP